MTLIFLMVFVTVPVLVWRYFRARRVAIIIIALWLGPVLFLLGFDLGMAGCANLPYTSVGGYLNCPTRAHEAIYAVFGPLASVLVVLLLSPGLTSLALFLLPLVAGLALELVLRRTGR